MARTGIGVDIGGTATKVAFVDPRGRALRLLEVPTRYGSSPGAFAARVCGLIRRCESEMGFKASGAGLALAGDVDSAAGILRFSPNLPAWKGFRFKEAFSRRLRRPVVVDNDANSAVWGGYVMELGRRVPNVLGLTLGTGVGGGLVIGGRLYRGSTGTAGEAGHMRVRRPGAPCHCGRRGCLEAYAGSYGIVRTARSLLRSSKRPSLLRRGTLTPETICAAARKGDRVAREVWERTGEVLGQALSDLVLLLNPDAVLLLGGISRAGRLLLDPARRVLRENPFRTPARGVALRLARRHTWGCVGAALLALEESGR